MDNVQQAPVIVAKMHVKAERDVEYTGFAGNHEYKVFRDGKPLSPEPSLAIVNHSPTGFCWGYGGSGPAQLALALLLDVTGDRDTALLNYQEFKWQVVAKWPMGSNWQLWRSAIVAWLKTRGVKLGTK